MNLLGSTLILFSITPLALALAIAARSASAFSSFGIGMAVDELYALPSSPPSSATSNARISTALAASFGNDLRKRSEHSAAVCSALNHQDHDPQGRLTEDHIYKWVFAQCSSTDANLFWVTCSHETRRVISGTVSYTYLRRSGRCKPDRECFAILNQVNFRGEIVEDVGCRPVAHGKPKDLHDRTEDRIPIHPHANMPTAGCSRPITIPPSEQASSSRGAGSTTGRRRYSLSQDLKLTDGRALRADDMYILDVSSQVPWKRSEIRDASSDSIELTIVGNAVRKVKFCAVLAAGYGYSALLHYVVQDITRKAQEDALADPTMKAVPLAEHP